MSRINDTNSYHSNGKTSQLIIISKSRKSSEKQIQNFLTINDGKNKIIYELGIQEINSKKLKKTFSTLKEALLKYSNSTGRMVKPNKKINIFPKRNKLNLTINSENEYKNKNKKGHNINNLETCNILITNDNNINNKDKNNNELIHVIDNDKSSNSSNKENKNNILEKNKNNNEIKIDDDNNEMEDSFNLNLEGLKIMSIEKINNEEKNLNNIAHKNLISQNYFNNIKHTKNKIEEEYKIYKSEEIKNPIKQKSDKAVKSISDYKSKLNENINILESEISENKRYLNLNTKNRASKNNNNLITEERQLNIEKEEEEKKEEEDNYEENLNNIIDKDDYYKYVVQTKEDEDYFNCNICDYSYINSQMFIPECNVHYFCKRCSKNYYEDKIDDGIRHLFCPFLQCKKKVNLEKLKPFISQDHYSKLKLYNRTLENLEENKLTLSRLKTENNKENIELYSRKHVIDVNTNKNFYQYKGIKDYFCPFCNEEALFLLTNNHFYKCLNCLSKICKYCFKEFNNRHIDINNPERCKVYNRCWENNNQEQNKFYTFLLQLFLVLATYYLTFAGIFILLKNVSFNKFKTNKHKISFKFILCYIFSILIFIVIIPFIILLYPYFPAITAIFDCY